MADKDTLWTEVKTAYAIKGLVPLTNIYDTSDESVDDTVGTAAARQAIALFPAYAETAFDITDELHIAVGVRAVIAVLWERGGTSPTIAKEEFTAVFGSEGLIGRVKKTGPRGHKAPKTNSNLTQPTGLTSAGQRKIPWSSPESLPLSGRGILPNDTIAN